MRIGFTILFIGFLACVAMGQDKPSMSRHALSLGTTGYIWTGDPYLTFGIQYGVRYDWIFAKHLFLGIGAQKIGIPDRSYLAMPIEIYYGQSVDRLGVIIGGGAILHEEDEFFEPALFPTAQLILRLKSKKHNFFVDLHGNLLFSYNYTSRFGTYSTPFDRMGWTVSPGFGLSLGFFL